MRYAPDQQFFGSQFAPAALQHEILVMSLACDQAAPSGGQGATIVELKQ